MAIKFFIDENLGIDLVKGLRSLGHTNIEHILETFEPGVIDEEWLKYVGENRFAIITKDRNIRKNPREKTLLKKYNSPFPPFIYNFVPIKLVVIRLSIWCQRNAK